MFANETQENIVTEVYDCNGFFGWPCWAIHPGADFGGSFPENRVLTNFNYASGPLDLHLAWRWIDGMDNAAILVSADFGVPEPVFAVPAVSSYNYFDLGVSYRLTDALRLRFGINNLADEEAPNMGTNGPDHNTDTRLYDVFGRSYYLSFTWNASG